MFGTGVRFAQCWDPAVTQRRPRLYDRPYLDWLKTRYCVVCGRPGPNDPAHIRSASMKYDKPLTGAGRKPDDRWAVPLCRADHDAQHAAGDELKWWNGYSLDPFELAIAYYAQFGGKGGKPKPRTIIKPRLPKEQRTKIQGRSSWPRRKFGR